MRVKWVKFVRKHRPDFKDPSDFQVHCALLGALRGRLLRVQIIGDWYNRAEWESKYPRLYKEDRCAHKRYCCSCSSRRSSQWLNKRTSKPNICDIKTCMFDQLCSTYSQWYKVILFGRLSPPCCWYIEKHRHTSFIVLVITRVKDGARMGFRYYDRLWAFLTKTLASTCKFSCCSVTTAVFFFLVLRVIWPTLINLLFNFSETTWINSKMYNCCSLIHVQSKRYYSRAILFLLREQPLPPEQLKNLRIVQMQKPGHTRTSCQAT